MNVKTAKLSELEVLQLVHERGSLSRFDLARLAEGTSFSTLYRILDQLVQKEYLIEEFDKDIPAAGKARRYLSGRPPKFYHINPKAAMAIGVYISWDSAGIGLVDMGGTIHEQSVFCGDEIQIPKNTIKLISEEIKRFRAFHGGITGIGVSSFGSHIRNKGIIGYNYNKPSPLWDYLPIKALLESETDLPVYIDNIPGALLLHELDNNKTLMRKRVVYFFIDRGVGSAFFAPGIINPGFIITDQFGHIAIDIVHGDTCFCGRKGCLITYASAEAIAKSLQGGKTNETDPFDILNTMAAEFDENVIKNMLEPLATALTIAILDYTTILYPDYMFLGGRTAKIFPQLLAMVEKNVRENLKNTDFFNPFEMHVAEFSNDGLIHGAANIVFRNVYHFFT
jgi:predicted NBD/HSP70 family sugar kinase